MDETNPLKTEPFRRSRGPNVARFVRDNAKYLRDRLEAGETAADVRSIVEAMLGVTLRPKAFASTLSRELKVAGHGKPRVGARGAQLALPNLDAHPVRPRRLTPNP